MSPSLPTPAFLYILNIFLSPTLPKFPFSHNCHATPKGHGLPPLQNSERALIDGTTSGCARQDGTLKGAPNWGPFDGTI